MSATCVINECHDTQMVDDTHGEIGLCISAGRATLVIGILVLHIVS